MGLAEQARAGRPAERVPVVRVRGAGWERGSDMVCGEEPLEIRLGGERVAVTMRTPAAGQDAELALGFLLGEGIVNPEQVARISECRSAEGDGGVADVLLWPDAQPAPGWQRDFYATASCGICGRHGIESVRAAAAPVPDGPLVSTGTLTALPDALRERQRVFDRTGGLHAAALFTRSGEAVAVREDVGRHNAVDKLIGRGAMDRLALHDHILMVSGRVSFEIVQKALLAGLPVVAAVSAPSSLAVRLAREANMTLVGFLRAETFNVYAGAERVDRTNADPNPRPPDLAGSDDAGKRSGRCMTDS
jgi:FdhD protein